VVLAGQGPAPAGATIEHFRSLGPVLIPGAGLLAAAVPAAVDAWLLLLRDHGTRSLREVLSYAIGYARQGHPLGEGVVATIEGVRELFIRHWPSSAEVWLRSGLAPAAGRIFANPLYAGTLERLIHEAEAAGPGREVQIDAARKAWREGFVADAIDAFARVPHRDSSGRDHAGVLTASDLAAFQVGYDQPLVTEFRDVVVTKTPPWGQGPVLLQMLRLLAPSADDALDPATADGIHLVAEAMKLAFADREAWYGDTGDVPITDLLSPDYADDRRRLIGPEASRELRPGAPGGRPPRLAAFIRDDRRPEDDPVSDLSTGEPSLAPHGVAGGDTCHVDVVDRWGNIISATPSGGWLQSSPTVPQLGFCLGTRLQMAWLEPGLPASLQPGRRPRTTLSPTLVLRGDVPVLACGTPGGDKQDQWQLLFLLRHLALGTDLQEAMDAPAWHTTAFPSSFYPRETVPAGLVLEDRVDANVIGELRRRGHEVTVDKPWSQGWLCAVARDSETGMLSAAASPRDMQGYACGR
jgi:gamma-glutamyltranspeptidase / glutathione hydrolase